MDMEKFKGECKDGEHCWHRKRGPLWMVLKDGYVVLECCKCTAIKTVHADHLHEELHNGKTRFSCAAKNEER